MSKPIVIAVTGNPPDKTLETLGNFGEWIIASHDDGGFLIVDCTHCVDASELPIADDIGGVIITGSPSMVTDREPWSLLLEQWVVDLSMTDTPVLGICYGHQLIAQALGGSVGLHPKGREIGSVPIELSNDCKKDPLFSASPSFYYANVTHAQSVLTLPPGATLLASNDYEPHQAFSIGNNMWGVQYHPEFSANIMRFYLFERYDSLQEQGLNIQTLFEEVQETPYSRGLLDNFISLCQKVTE
ncbi:hypothetical protein A9Q99_27660 [Gammaproteobacteria bacterium 45_16_T64]|nr:hypothetical protein A9Q99_27660 [Gammaproteobacteria bacterium 45_16_T64]